METEFGLAVASFFLHHEDADGALIALTALIFLAVGNWNSISMWIKRSRARFTKKE